MERFNLRKLSELVVRRQYLAASENLNDSEDMYRALENIKENIKTSAKERVCVYELKQHKPRFDEGSFMTFRSKEAG
jgi:hypothetical protein